MFGIDIISKKNNRKKITTQKNMIWNMHLKKVVRIQNQMINQLQIQYENIIYFYINK